MSEIRSAYNKAFTPEKYEAFLQDIYKAYSYQPKFRIAESPLFIPNDLKQRLIDACDEISDVIIRPDFIVLALAFHYKFGLGAFSLSRKSCVSFSFAFLTSLINPTFLALGFSFLICCVCCFLLALFLIREVL